MSEPNEVQKNSVSEPSSSSDTPTGSLGKRATRGAINGIKNGIKNIGNMIPMHIKLLVFGPVLLIVCIFILLMAIFNLAISSEESDTAVSSSTTYVESQSFNSGSKAKEYFENSASLLLFKLKDINGLYKSTLESARDSTKENFSYELGSTAVSNEESRIVDINEKLPIYKHILLTEKYNFNNVVWKVYGHSYNGEEIKNINSGNIKMKEDKDLGITYPEKGNNESDYKLDKFVNLVYPYLQTWYIPLAFLSASAATGTEDTANNPQFAYNIIKEAYSKIVINRYEIEKRTVKTYYTEIDKVTKHNKITVQLNKKTITTRTTDEDGNIVGNESSSETYLIAPLAVGTTYSQDLTSTQSFSEVTDNTEHLNSRYDADKNEDPKKETLVDDNISTTSKYYIAESKTFDLKIINEFNYEKYKEQDVENRVNPKSQKIENSEYTKDSENIQNKNVISIAPDDIDGEGNSNISSLFRSKIPNNGFSMTKKEELNSNNPYVSTSEINIPVMDTVTSQEGDFPSITFRTHTITTTTTITPYATYEINIAPFVEYENGVKHNVTRQWEDELSQTKSTSSAYTIDDLIEFNESDDRAEKVTSEELCGSSSNTSSNSGSNTQSGTGTSEPTTEIEINGKTYPVFNQSDFGGNIPGAGCGLCSITVVIDGIQGQSYSPQDVANRTGWSNAKMIYQYAEDLKYVFNINCTYKTWNLNGYSGGVGSISHGSSTAELDNIKNVSRSDIDANLREGNPVIVQVKGDQEASFFYTVEGHYIVLLGYDNDGKVVVANSAGGEKQTADLDFILRAMYDNAQSDHGYILVNNGSSTSSSSSNGTVGNSSNTQNNVNSSSSSNSQTTSRSCDTEDGQYYKLYEKNKELNLIDFINSNPGIYKNYTRSSYSDYVGYSRGYLLYHYNELKRLLGKLKGEDGLLPFVYGQSLGFGVKPIDTQISSSMSHSSRSGLNAMCQKAIELAQSNDGNGLWHYCQGGDNTNGKHENIKNGKTYGRFTFSSVDEMNEYIELANNGEPVGLDCSAFVESMYKAYTGVDIDPNGSGSNINSYASTHETLEGANNITIQYNSINSIEDLNNAKPGDVLYMPGHLALYVGKIDGKHMLVDQGGGGDGYCGWKTNGTSWKGPKYHEVSSSYTAYIHYEGIAGAGASDTTQELMLYENANPPTRTNDRGELCYVIESDASHHGPTVGHGVDIIYGEFEDEFQAAGYTYNIGDLVPVEFVDGLRDKTIDEHRNYAINYTSGLGLEEYQIEALTMRAYALGDAGAFEAGYNNGNEFNSVYRSYWVQSRDAKFGNKDAVNYNHQLFQKVMSNSNGGSLAGFLPRRKGEWLLFQTGWYKNLGKYYGQ